MSRFALIGGESELLTWEDGVVGGYPDSLLDTAREALSVSPRGSTFTGPFYPTETPEGAWLALAPLVAATEVYGRPVIPTQPDELDESDPDPLVEAADIDGAMIAFYPSPEAARQLAVKGGDPPGQLHMTLKFLGSDATKIPGKLLDSIRKALSGFAAECPAMSGHVSGVGEFAGKPDVDEKPVFAKIELPGVQAFRKRLVAALPDGVMEDTYDDFKPHMTLMYVPKKERVAVDLPRVPVRFDAVWLVVASKKERFPLLGRVQEGVFDEAEHPRGRKGQWVRKGWHELVPGDRIRHGSGTHGTVSFVGGGSSWMAAKWDDPGPPLRFSRDEPIEHVPGEDTGGVLGSVAERVKLPKKGALRDTMEPVLAAIDKVLVLPEHMPEIPVRAHSGKGMRGAYELEKVRDENDEFHGEYRTVQMKVTTKPFNEHITESALTAAHEIGHWIDNQAFAATNSNRYESMTMIFSRATPEQRAEMPGWAQVNYPAGHESPLGEWYFAVKLSDAYKELTTNISYSELGTVKYLVNPKELFARSFAQWVAVHSGDPALLKGVREWRDYPPETTEIIPHPWDKTRPGRERISASPKSFLHRQWSDEDFAPIDAALTSAFRKAGLLRA